MKKSLAFTLSILVGIFAAACVIVILSACATSQNISQNSSLAFITPGAIQTQHDEFDGTTTVIMTPRIMGLTPGAIGGNVAIGLIKYTKDSLSLYSVWIRYQDSDWMFISEEDPLEFLVDGIKISLALGATPNRDIRSSYVTESAMYLASSEQIQELYSAKEVKVRVHGKAYRDRFFTPENTDDFRRFYTQVVLDTTKK